MKSLQTMISYAFLAGCSTCVWADDAHLNFSSYNSPNLLATNSSSSSQISLLGSSNQHNQGLDIVEGEDVQYAIYRSRGDVYFKGRAGYLTDKTELDFADIPIEDIIDGFDDNGALGIGAGYRLKNGNQFELEYTVTKRAEQIIQIEYLF